MASPRGLEVLLKKASVDPDFRRELLADPESAAAAIGLELDPVERSMLRNMPGEQLATVIDRTEVPLPQRRIFLGRVAATMLAVLTGGQAALAGDPADAGKVYEWVPPQLGSFGGIRSDMIPATRSSIRVTLDENGDISLLDRVRVVLARRNRQEFDATGPETSLRFRRDHLQRVRLELAAEFGFGIPASTLRTLTTVQELVDFIAASLEGYEEEPETGPDEPSGEKPESPLKKNGWREVRTDPEDERRRQATWFESHKQETWETLGKHLDEPIAPNYGNVRDFLMRGLHVPGSQLRNSVRLELAEEDFPAFRQAIYRNFGVKMPMKTLKSFLTVGQFVKYLLDASVGNDTTCGNRHGPGFW